MKEPKIILGIDPGTIIMGYSLIQCQGRQPRLLEMGVLKLSGRKDPYERLQLIHQKVHDLIVAFRPQDFAIEAPFFGKNVQSMLKLGRAQGVAIATAMHSGIPVTEYSPKKVKQSITGNGNADKDQVWKMLQSILGLEEVISHYDASDALAVAVCHHFQEPITAIGKRGPIGSAADTPKVTKASRRSKAGDWEAFLQQNPSRLKARK